MVKMQNINTKIVDFISELRKNIRIKTIYLFGSSINARNNKYSDVDLAIVSDDFTGFKFEDRKKINPIILKINTSIEVHPFTDKEFKEKNPFIKEILRTGKKIF